MLKPSKSDKLIRELFVGRLENYIECLDVDYKSTKEEVFYDLQVVLFVVAADCTLLLVLS